MKHILPALLIFLSALNISASTTGNWKAKMQEQKVFIENKGQFDNLNNIPGSEVLFGTDKYSSLILFTKKGLTYRLEEAVRPSKEEQEESEEEMANEMKDGKKISHEEMEKEEHRMIIRRDFVQMQWENSNPNVEVMAEKAVSNYFNYCSNGKGIDHAKGYQKLIYKNLYPNIDVEYVFHPKGGIEYSVILHPGADASQVKMKYSDVSKVKTDDKGNILLPTIFGNIIEHAPKTFYKGNKSNSITSGFICNGKHVAFSIGTYDKSQTVIIDPWVQTPAFATQWDCVWECEKDAAGNVYIIGGVMPEQLLKYNSTGNLQWTYTTPYDTANFWLGTLATDNAGNSYITGGSLAAIEKINTSGALVWNNPSPGGIFSSTEFWSISFNCDQTKLVIGGTGNILPPQPYVYQVDMNSGNVTNSIRVTDGAILPTEEVRSITACGNGKYYFLTHDSIGYLNQNFSLCSSPGQAKQYFDNTYHLGYKCENFRVNNTGICALKTYNSFVYVNRGNRLDKRNFTTGAIISSVTIPGGAYTTQFGSSYVENSGIDIDGCGNIYVGSKNQVVKFDQNLTQLATYSTSFNVYDVQVSTNGDIIACGSTGNSNSGARSGSIQSFAASACAPVAITCCDASVCGAGPLCTTAGPVTLTPSTPGGTWSGTGITNTSTGVFNPSVAGTGIHYVTNTLACGSDSIAIIVSPCAPLSVCIENNGNLTASNGVGPYNWDQQVQQQDCSACFPAVPPFIQPCSTPPGCAVTVNAWQHFATGITVTPPGTYPLQVTDEAGTVFSIANAGSLPSCVACALTASATSTPTTCGSTNGSATAIAGGGTPTGYAWSSGATTATAANLAAGNYTVTITSSGCNATATVTVSSSNGVSLTPSSTNAGCGISNGSASVAATGGNGSFTYQWSNGGTNSAISNVAAGSYTVTVTSNGCTATTSVTVSSANAVSLTPSSTNAGCAPTGSATVAPAGGNGSFTYVWSNNATTSTISNIAAGNYTVTVTSAGCTASASFTIASTGSVTASTSTTNAGCTTTGSATVIPSGGTGSFTYSWSNGGTTATISNLAGGTYTVLVTSGSCTVTSAAQVVSTGGVTLSSSVTNTTCGNANGGVSVNPTTGSAPFAYSWSNGGNTSSISNVAAGTYSTTVTDGGGCSATLSAVINSSTVAPALIVTADSLICSGDSTQICVVGNNYISYQWNTNEITQCIYAKLAGNYYVTVTDNSNCIGFSNHIPLSIYPLPPVSISQNGDTLQVYHAVTQQWYFGNTLIPNATSNIYVAPQAGDYYVAVTDSNGCRATSTKVTVIKTGIISLGKEEEIKIYPNPLESGNWNLEVGNSLIGGTVEIFDADGRLAYKSEIRSLKSEINLNVASGVYMMRIRSNAFSVSHKLIKL